MLVSALKRALPIMMQAAQVRALCCARACLPAALQYAILCQNWSERKAWPTEGSH
jgi:hypothetical protein